MTTNYRTIAVLSGLAGASFLLGAALHAGEPGSTEKRARPPEFTADVRDVFFDDARTKLAGTRPDYRPAPAGTVVHGEPEPAAPDAAGPSPRAAEWSKRIDAETIETEIKRLAQAVANDVSTPSAFKGGAYEDARQHFSVLAVLFAVAAEYDGDVRWQDSAPALRDLFARAGRNCKVGTDQTYKEAAQRKQELADLIGGSRPKLPAAEKDVAWGQVADRPPLMQRLNLAHEERLTKWLANERLFKQHHDDVLHEAQLVAAIADVIGRQGFDYWDEEEYALHVRGLREAAVDLSTAVELDNFQQAQQAISRATKSCADCHELYRG